MRALTESHAEDRDSAFASCTAVDQRAWPAAVLLRQMQFADSSQCSADPRRIVQLEVVAARIRLKRAHINHTVLLLPTVLTPLAEEWFPEPSACSVLTSRPGYACKPGRLLDRHRANWRGSDTQGAEPQFNLKADQYPADLQGAAAGRTVEPHDSVIREHQATLH